MENEERNGPYGSIFDEAFRKMMEKMPRLVVSLVNEMFGTEYPDDAEVIQLRNEHHEINGTLVTDALIGIGGRLFHIECQSARDGTISIRMIEYDFAVAFERAKKETDGRYHVRLPESCVLYVRNHRSVPQRHEIVVDMPDGRSFMYVTKAMLAQDYGVEDMFKKRLHILLPFHILRYESFLKGSRDDARKLKNSTCTVGASKTLQPTP